MTLPYNADIMYKNYSNQSSNPIDLFWKDFYTRMVPQKDILNERYGVPYYLKKYYNNSLTEDQKAEILAKAKNLQKNSSYPYKGGKRKTKKTRKHMKKRVSKKLKSRKAH